MKILKKIGIALAGFVAGVELIEQIIGFLAIPAVILIIGLLNGYPTTYYVYALVIYLLLYLAGRLLSHRIGKWLERKLEKKA